MLAGACAEIDPSLAVTLDAAEVLSKYAWRFRYPGAPYEPDAEEAAQGRALAEAVKAEISPKLPPGSVK